MDIVPSKPRRSANWVRWLALEATFLLAKFVFPPIADHQNLLRKKLIVVKNMAIVIKNNPAVTKGSYEE